jgi:1-pyrroline-5-carboxylate dehydrogenase
MLCRGFAMDKITYASLGNLGEEFHRSFDAALVHERKKLGQSHPLFINGKPIKTAKTFADTNPARNDQILGRFQCGSREHVRKAVAAARNALPFWQELGWPARVNFLRKSAELISRHQFELAALLSLEVGKNRTEAIAEVSEAADLVLYYCQQMEAHHGFEMVMSGSGSERTRSVMRPHGVFAVVSPFNFPLALATGMSAAALLGGNSVIFKPASDTPFTGLRLYEIFHRAGLPVGVFNLITGGGNDICNELIANQDVDGIAFTGSREVGLELLSRFNAERSRPCIAEMGGKNPCIVMPTSILEDAVEGVMRAAFGMGGQKCSACSRVYVHQSIARKFIEALADKTRSLAIGDPTEPGTFLGPLINKAAVDKYKAAVKLGRKDGKLLIGGAVRGKGEFAQGHFVEPTILQDVDDDSKWFEEEFFSPVVAVNAVRSLEEAIKLANTGRFGLTAGIFTQIEDEQRQFFDCIEAGVAYCNRRSGATTGAWPGVQSFGGWKDSGSTGKNALGPHYLPQFMREQSQTLIMKSAPARMAPAPRRADLVPVF